MNTLTRPPDNPPADPPGPDVTPYFTAEHERLAALRGLPPESRTA